MGFSNPWKKCFQGLELFPLIFPIIGKLGVLRTTICKILVFHARFIRRYRLGSTMILSNSLVAALPRWVFGVKTLSQISSFAFSKTV